MEFQYKRILISAKFQYNYTGISLILGKGRKTQVPGAKVMETIE